MVKNSEQIKNEFVLSSNVDEWKWPPGLEKAFAELTGGKKLVKEDPMYKEFSEDNKELIREGLHKVNSNIGLTFVFQMVLIVNIPKQNLKLMIHI